MEKDKSGGKIDLQPMTMDDIPFGLQLSTAAGWNQTEADWRMLLENSLTGCYVAIFNGVEVGTVTTVTYSGYIHWIGMVLVTPGYRRRGIGTALVEAVLSCFQGKDTFYLDATPLGRPLYERLGFKEMYPLKRFLRHPQPLEKPTRPILMSTPHHLSEIQGYDAVGFGADRSAILSSLYERSPNLTIVAKENRKVSGICMGRQGRKYTQIGPVLADDFIIARNMLATEILNHQAHDLIIDSHVHQPGWNHYLEELGFSEKRSFMRMRLGKSLLPEQHIRQYAIAGPELG